MRLHPEYSHDFTDSSILNNYLLGGHAVVTLESPKGTSHTYLYARPRNAESFPDDVRFVYALHDGVKELYIGMIELDTFRLTRNSRFLPDTDIVRGAKYIENMRKNNQFLQASPMRIYHQGTCGRCRRKLTDDRSMVLGFGPKCRKRIEGEL